MKNSITSAKALQPLDWYKKEINRTIQDIGKLKTLKTSALFEYNSHMAKNVGLGVKVTITDDKKLKKDLTKAFKEDYQSLTEKYKRYVDLETQYLLKLKYLDSLKEERRRAYESESRK